MTIEQMRGEIINIYPSLSWIEKVSKMPDAQVIAIYKRLHRGMNFDNVEFERIQDAEEILGTDG